MYVCVCVCALVCVSRLQPEQPHMSADVSVTSLLNATSKFLFDLVIDGDIVRLVFVSFTHVCRSCCVTSCHSFAIGAYL